jgi:hypothetical protein
VAVVGGRDCRKRVVRVEGRELWEGEGESKSGRRETLSDN